MTRAGERACSMYGVTRRGLWGTAWDAGSRSCPEEAEKGGSRLNEAVLVALIGLAGSGAGAFGGILISSRLTQYRLEQLEKRVQAHNNLIERTYKLEERTELQEEKLRVANHRISDLEEAGKP